MRNPVNTGRLTTWCHSRAKKPQQVDHTVNLGTAYEPQQSVTFFKQWETVFRTHRPQKQMSLSLHSDLEPDQTADEAQASFLLHGHAVPSQIKFSNFWAKFFCSEQHELNEQQANLGTKRGQSKAGRTQNTPSTSRAHGKWGAGQKPEGKPTLTNSM